MDRKKLVKSLLFPRTIILFLLTMVSAFSLTLSLVYLGNDNVISYISYALSFYTLTVWCFRFPSIIRFIRRFLRENKYTSRLLKDPRLRINVSLVSSFLWDVFYTVFQFGLGVINKSFWFYSLSVYYALLAFIRFFMVKYTLRHGVREKLEKELKTYRFCGFILLTMNLTLSVIVFFMIYWNKTFVHGEIITIALATYTFYSLTLAIIGIIRYRKYKSPIYSATKAISLVSTSVSMITLESTMLNTFGGETSTLNKKLMLGLSGGGVALFIIFIAVYMIVKGGKQLRLLQSRERKMQMDNENKEFQFSYSATEQSEIKRIRESYLTSEESKTKEENKLERLRRLDASVSKKATTVSIIIGVIGILIFGFGMSLCMSDLGDILSFDSRISMIVGVIVGLLGIVVSLVAYPVYNLVLKSEKKKVTPEILSLTEELLK